MLQIFCDKCDKELNEAGALLFGIPDSDKTEKYHLCKKCFNRLLNEWLYKRQKD